MVDTGCNSIGNPWPRSGLSEAMEFLDRNIGVAGHVPLGKSNYAMFGELVGVVQVPRRPFLTDSVRLISHHSLDPNNWSNLGNL